MKTIFKFRAFIFGALAAATILYVLGSEGNEWRFWAAEVLVVTLWALLDTVAIRRTLAGRGTDQLRLVLREDDFRRLVAGREAKLVEKKTEIRLVLEDLGLDRMERILYEENPPF